MIMSASNTTDRFLPAYMTGLSRAGVSLAFLAGFAWRLSNNSRRRYEKEDLLGRPGLPFQLLTRRNAGSLRALLRTNSCQRRMAMLLRSSSRTGRVQLSL